MKALVTGGAGFLGRGILRRWSRGDLPDWEGLTVLSRDETKQDEARKRYPDAHFVLGDIRDTERLALVASGHDIILHGGAVKYVPDAELNPQETVSVNVHGSESVILAACKANVRRVVGISSDKAVLCVNVYGATKMVMERLFSDRNLIAAQRRNPDSLPAFTCVRYGNVVGSTGSVIPLFARQYAETGRVQITDEHMTRFWMSVDQAIDTILLALEATPGAVVVPYASAMTILDVARAATVDDVPYDVSGVRPGEKMHEKLVHHEESVRAWRKETHIELLPVGFAEGVPSQEAFTVSSQYVHGLTVAEMRAMIADAREI